MALGLNSTIAPDWANKWSERLKLSIDGLVSVKTKIIDTTADLPDPRSWNQRQIWCKDVTGGTGRLLISDGVNWRRTDTGAII